jgi:hypothetical protein
MTKPHIVLRVSTNPRYYQDLNTWGLFGLVVKFEWPRVFIEVGIEYRWTQK